MCARVAVGSAEQLLVWESITYGINSFGVEHGLETKNRILKVNTHNHRASYFHRVLDTFSLGYYAG